MRLRVSRVFYQRTLFYSHTISCIVSAGLAIAFIFALYTLSIPFCLTQTLFLYAESAIFRRRLLSIALKDHFIIGISLASYHISWLSSPPYAAT